MKYLLNIQLFSEDGATQTPNVDVNNDPTKRAEDDVKKESYVKIRIDKAIDSLLKQLGVADVNEASSLIEAGKTSANRISELENTIANERTARVNETKRNKLIHLLDNEKVFDSDALLNYVDINKVEIDDAGQIKDSANIISALKEKKPHYFGKESVGTDKHRQQTQQTQPNEIVADYEAGNYVSAVAKYLKNAKK